MTVRPKYILAHYADVAGCGHHRILRPMEIMARSGLIGGRWDASFWPDENLAAVEPDVVVFQRQHEDTQIATIERYRKAVPNTFIVYELDDILSAVPPWSIHASFIPHDVDDRMRRAIEHCHAVSVSTKDLSEHIKKICGDNVDIRIVPNMLGKDELQNISEIRKNRGIPIGKPRIGWGGGISHKGDLDLLIPVIEALHDKVDFVFLGMKPDTDAPVEFHEGVPPREYTPKLASLNLDLMLAPLVECQFNRCKSNLRLLEAGACGYPVIASRVRPYVEGQPPVFAYADDDGWQAAIEKWLKDRPDGSKLQDWVLKKFVFDDKIEERLKGWLPYNAKVFRPKQRSVSASDVTIVTPGIPTMEKHRTVKKFDDVGDVNSDVLYLRMGSFITDAQIARMRERLKSSKFASVCTISNDGGITSFPRVGGFLPIDQPLGMRIDQCAASLFPNSTMEIPFGAGPAILMSRKVIDMIGLPTDTDDVQDMEGAIIEWGVQAAARGFPNVVAVDTYVPAVVQTVFERFRHVLARISLRWPPTQTPPDPLGEVRAHLEMNFHREFYLQPPMTTPNNYDEWVMFGDEPGTRDIEFFEEQEAWITEKLAGWSIQNEGVLAPHARYMFAKTISENPDAVLIYADHDYVDGEGKRCQHDFKPHRLDFEMLLGRDYITPVFALRDSERAGKFFNSWYDAVLHTITAQSREHVVHIPLCLAHLKQRSDEEAAQLTLVNIETANRFLQSVGRHARVHPNPLYKQFGDVEYMVDGDEPLISIIIVTGGRVEMLSPCINTLLHFTKYQNYELIVVTDKKVPEVCQTYLDSIADNPKVNIFNWPKPYNWSAKNNFGVKHAKGSYYLFLNDDTRFAEPGWLTDMVGAAQLPQVGTVGARMFYPAGTIQHIGVICNEGLTGHIAKGMSSHLAGYNGYNIISHEVTANTGACLLVSKARYDEIGGLDESYAHNFNDVAFCIEMNRRGYHHILPGRATLQHLEGVTRTSPVSEHGMRIQIEEGQRLGKAYPDKDLFWNSNLHFAHAGGNLFVSGLNMDTLRWPKEPWPWRNEDWRHDKLLVVGDGVDGIADIRNGDIVYYSKCIGFNIKIERPQVENVPPFDLRDLPRARAIINGFGINRIVVGTIAGGVPEVLRFLLKIGIPVEYRPVTGEAVCPRLDFKPNGEGCNGGYRRGQCGACLDEHSSLFGETNIPAWRDNWRIFLNSARVNKSLASPETLDALKEVYQK